MVVLITEGHPLLGQPAQGTPARLPLREARYPPQHYLDDLRFLGSYKRRFLAVAGAMISVAVLSTAALQKAVNAFHRVTAPGGKAVVPTAPSGLLSALGALFVAVLARVYLPCHVYMHQRGERLLDECVPLDLARPDVAVQIQKRHLIREELDLRRSARQTLTDAIIILAPLLSGALSLLIAPDK